MAVKFKKSHSGEWAFHLHHQALIERVTQQGINARLSYIYGKKDASEIDLRISLIRIAKNQRRINQLHEKWAADNYLSTKVKRELLKMHREQCKFNCPWTKAEYQESSEFSPDGNELTRKRGDLFVLRGQGGRIVPEYEWS